MKDNHIDVCFTFTERGNRLIITSKGADDIGYVVSSHDVNKRLSSEEKLVDAFRKHLDKRKQGILAQEVSNE